MPSKRRSTVSVALIFFVNGMVFSNWIPRISEVRDRMGVSNSGLGISLLGGGLGGFLGSMLVARVVRHVRTKTVVILASVIISGLVPLVAVVPNPLTFLLLMTCLGFSDVQNDVAFNAQGAMIQPGSPVKPGAPPTMIPGATTTTTVERQPSPPPGSPPSAQPNSQDKEKEPQRQEPPRTRARAKASPPMKVKKRGPRGSMATMLARLRDEGALESASNDD